jgi:hypothetical protein
VRKIMILMAVVMLVVMFGMQSPQKAFAQAGGKAYEAARGEIHLIDPSAVASYASRELSKECSVILIGPKTKTAVPSGKGAIRLYVCGTSGEPYCITQAGKQVCYPPH